MLVKVKEHFSGFDKEYSELIKGKFYPVYAIEVFPNGYEIFHILGEYYDLYDSDELEYAKEKGYRFLSRLGGEMFDIVENVLDNFTFHFRKENDFVVVEIIPELFPNFKNIIKNEQNRKNNDNFASVLKNYYSGDDINKSEAILILQELIDYVNNKYHLESAILVEHRSIYDLYKKYSV